MRKKNSPLDQRPVHRLPQELKTRHAQDPGTKVVLQIPFVEPANLNPAALPMATRTNMAVVMDDFE